MASSMWEGCHAAACGKWHAQIGLGPSARAGQPSHTVCAAVTHLCQLSTTPKHLRMQKLWSCLITGRGARVCAGEWRMGVGLSAIEPMATAWACACCVSMSTSYRPPLALANTTAGCCQWVLNMACLPVRKHKPKPCVKRSCQKHARSNHLPHASSSCKRVCHAPSTVSAAPCLAPLTMASPSARPCSCGHSCRPGACAATGGALPP